MNEDIKAKIHAILDAKIQKQNEKQSAEDSTKSDEAERLRKGKQILETVVRPALSAFAATIQGKAECVIENFGEGYWKERGHPNTEDDLHGPGILLAMKEIKQHFFCKSLFLFWVGLGFFELRDGVKGYW